MALKTTTRKGNLTLVSRFLLARRIGLMIVVTHVALGLLLVWLGSTLRDAHDRDVMWELLRISVPLTSAYFAAVLYWFTAKPGKEELEATVDTTAAMGIYFVFTAFVVSLFAIPLIYIWNNPFTPALAKNIYTAIELIFGAGIGGMARVLFPQATGEEKKEAVTTEDAAPQA